MAEKYKEYLAAAVLTENKPVTYRLLSRALKVNNNTAKQMICDFHRKQNSKKPKSVHATYLLTGKKRSQQPTNGTYTQDGEGDSFMHSSPFMSSMPESGEPAEEPVPITSMLLVREEELEKTKAEYDEITSIHIYSLEPGPIENMNMLSVCNQEIAKEYASEDPLERWKMYGSHHNPHIVRRTTKYAPPVTSTKATTTVPKAAGRSSLNAQPKKEEQAAPAATRRGSASEDNKSAISTPQPSSKPPALKKQDSKPNLKRDTSDIFKSFAKAKPKSKETKSKESTPAPAEDESMGGMSEDEGDADDGPGVKFDEEKAAAARKVREDRQAKLRAMMEEEDDDEPMQDAPLEATEEATDAPLDKQAPEAPAEKQANVTIENGRRRGRRRVMKKKQEQDEDGYLVTKEEAVWESFSEDEPEPKKLKPAASKPAPSTAKGKPGAKKGQGNIASFFKKA